MNSSDERDCKLAERLGDVKVPEDLHDRLHRIPERLQELDRSATPMVVKEKRQLRGWIVAVAAVAALFGAVLFSVNRGNRPGNQKVNVPDAIDVQTSPDDPSPTETNSVVGNLTSAENILQEMQANSERIDALLSRRATERLKVRLAELRTYNRPDPGDAETLAIIYGMASQSSLELGASFESVRSDLRRVVDRYPNTNGARMARSLMKQNEL